MIAKMFRDSYQLEDEAGTSFYSFDRIPDPRAFKDRYRDLLDELPFTPQEKAIVAAEVKLAYDHNNRAGADLEERFAEYQG